MNKLPATLETRRLILKQPSMGELDELVALRTDADVMQYIGDGSVQSKEQVIEFINLADSYYKKTGFTFYSVFLKETEDFIGQAGIFHLSFNTDAKDIELAYRFKKEYWGSGYATEASKALLEIGFEKLNLELIIGIAYPKNIASQKVMEKLGMKYAGMQSYAGTSLRRYEIQKKAFLNQVF